MKDTHSETIQYIQDFRGPGQDYYNQFQKLQTFMYKNICGSSTKITFENLIPWPQVCFSLSFGEFVTNVMW